MRLLNNSKILIILGVFAVFAAFIVWQGLKFAPSSPQTSGVGWQTKLLADRRVSFGGNGKPEFSVQAPLGWAKGEEARVDLAIESIAKDKLPDGREFSTNIVFTIGKHEINAANIDDYASLWKDYLGNLYPGFEFTDDYKTKIGEFDVYVVEGTHTINNVELHQKQYVFYVDKNYVLAATVSSPVSFWDSHKAAIEASIKSVKRTSPYP